MRKQLSDGIPTINVEKPEDIISEIDYDALYSNSQKKHRNTIDSLNHWFRIATHPFILMVFLVFVGVLFLVASTFADALAKTWIINLAAQLKTFLSYLATFVFSSMFTWFLENYSKIKENKE